MGRDNEHLRGRYLKGDKCLHGRYLKVTSVCVGVSWTFLAYGIENTL